MGNINGQECRKEIIGGAKIQEFDPIEPTTINVFCSEICRDKWISATKKKEK
ncbi:MAG: hypothetical protein ACXAEX_04565 [Promethearchaeota archaeon]|jgi:hypothetical protein